MGTVPPGSAGLQVGAEAAPGLTRCDVALSLLWPQWFPECHLPLVTIPHPRGVPWEKRSSLPSLGERGAAVPQLGRHRVTVPLPLGPAGWLQSQSGSGPVCDQ